MSPSEESTRPSPAAAWEQLREGNRRFAAGHAEHPRQDAARLREVAAGQHPVATVLSCMDSRVPPEAVFDQGLGDLAVVRSAGHVLGSAVLGSVEFGVVGLGSPLVVVLGHDRCGAVKAAVSASATGELPGGFVRDVVERVTPSLDAAGVAGRQPADVDVTAVVDTHVRETVRLLLERSDILRDAVAGGRIAVVGARYGLDTGEVTPLVTEGPLEAAGAA